MSLPLLKNKLSIITETITHFIVFLPSKWKSSNLKKQKKIYWHLSAFGSEWDINKSVAQVHAFLFASTELVSIDEVMVALTISRGNANMSLRQLMDYGIIHQKVINRDRKEYFIGEKDIWEKRLKNAMMRK